MALSPVWNSMYAPSNTQQVASCNLNAYALASNGDIEFYDSNAAAWVWTSPPPVSNPIMGISGAHDGTAIVCATDGSAYIKLYNFWYQISSVNAISVAVGGAASYVIADNSGSIFKYENGFVDTVSEQGGPTKLSATPGVADLWGVDSSGTVYRWDSSLQVWDEVTGKSLSSVHVSLSSTGLLQVFGVDFSGAGWTYDTTTATWNEVYGPGVNVQFVSLEGGAGSLWAVTSTGSVYLGSI